MNYLLKRKKKIMMNFDQSKLLIEPKVSLKTAEFLIKSSVFLLFTEYL